MKRYYEILEVNPKASIEIIEKAYKVLIKKYHPDLYKGEEKIRAEEMTRDINEAYKILSDDFLRKQYDLELEKETEHDDIYKAKTNYDKGKKAETRKKKIDSKNNENEIEFDRRDIGTYKGIVNLTKSIFRNKPKIKNLKDLQREDYLAAGITAVIMIVLLILLWFIPFTNAFIKDMLPFLK